MLVVQDSQVDVNYFVDLVNIVKGGLMVQFFIGIMMECVFFGENLIGYNIFGFYVEVWVKNDFFLGIVYLKDYVLVFFCVLFISQESEYFNVVKLWLDYVLLEKGQQIFVSQVDIFFICCDIVGKNDIDGMIVLLGKVLKLILVNEMLFDYLQL